MQQLQHKQKTIVTGPILFLGHTGLELPLHQIKNLQEKPSMPGCSPQLGVNIELKTKILEVALWEIFAIKVYVVKSLNSIFEI